MNIADAMIHPVYEFRPLPNYFEDDFWRYADGTWIPDDGAYDLAFYGRDRGRFPMALYVKLPYQRNIIWSWLTTHWSTDYYDHKNRNPWHYYLREGATEWGGEWGRDTHSNTQAGDKAMRACGVKWSCANGRGPEFNLNDPYMKAGLVRVREDQHVIVPPSRPPCMYCGTRWVGYPI